MAVCGCRVSFCYRHYNWMLTLRNVASKTRQRSKLYVRSIKIKFRKCYINWTRAWKNSSRVISSGYNWIIINKWMWIFNSLARHGARLNTISYN